MRQRSIQERGWFERFKREIHRVNRFIAGVGACFLIPLMILTAGDVVGRDIPNRPIPGTIELSQYMLAVFILLGLAYTQQTKAHVGVSVLTSRLPPSAQLVLRVVAALLCLFISGILIWQGWVIGIEEKTVSDMLRVPQYPFRLMVAVAAFLLSLELVIDLGDSLVKMMGKAS